MSKYGIQVTQNTDVDTATEQQMLYSSDAQSPKLNAPSTGTVKTDASGNGTVSIIHNLGYSPVAIAYIKKDDGDWYGVDNENTGCQTDPFSVTLIANALTPNYTYSFKFWVFTDPASVIGLI